MRKSTAADDVFRTRLFRRPVAVAPCETIQLHRRKCVRKIAAPRAEAEMLLAQIDANLCDEENTERQTKDRPRGLRGALFVAGRLFVGNGAGRQPFRGFHAARAVLQIQTGAKLRRGFRAAKRSASDHAPALARLYQSDA